MNTLKSIIVSSLCALALSSCVSSEELDTRIKDLNSRVSMLEAVVGGLNQNVIALQAIAEGKAINSVTQKDGRYIITLSNGQVLTLNQGSIGMGKAPLLSIDASGHWMVDYQDGAGVQPVMYNGAPAIAIGTDGITPIFGVDADGYWTVSYDEGRNFSRVLDVNGMPVKAVADSSAGDSYFANVEYTDEYLTLTLKNGQKYTVPVDGGFFFKINVGEGDQVYQYGERKTYSVEKKGVADYSIIVPEGWNASISEMILTVTAPPKPETKATLADSRKDLSVIAFSNAGHVAVSKVKIYLSGAIYPGEVAAAGVSCVKATAMSLTFRVILENTTSWKYVFRKAVEPAPSVADMMLEGVTGTDTDITFEGLDAETNYSLYVLPYNESEGNGAIASNSASTTAFSDLYEAYLAGQDIMIAGERYNKFGTPAILVRATAANQNLGDMSLFPDFNVGEFAMYTGIVFMEQDPGCSFYINRQKIASNKTLFVGRSSTEKVKIVTGKQTCFFARPKTGGIGFKNVFFDCNDCPTYNNLFCHWGSDEEAAKGDPLFLHFDNCVFDLDETNTNGAGIYYSNPQPHAYTSIRFHNCYFDLSGRDGSSAQLMLIDKSCINGFKDIQFVNNVFYSDVPTPYYLFNFSFPVSDNKEYWPDYGEVGEEHFTIKNNTFYNVVSSYMFVKTFHFDSFTFSKNICYSDGLAMIGGSMLQYGSVFTTYYQSWSREPHLDVYDNLFYSPGNALTWTLYSKNDATNFSGVSDNQPALAGFNPIPNANKGVFCTSTGYGSTVTGK